MKRKWISNGDSKEQYDLIPFVKKKLAELVDYDVRIYIGTDSQNLRRWTGYVTAISFHIGINEFGEFMGNGAQTIYYPIKVRKERDKFTRLWRESMLTLEVIETLRNAGILVHQVDLDYNDDESAFSNRLVSAGKGMFTGFGYNVSVKPHEQIATRAADHIIKHINWTKIGSSVL